MPRRCARCSTSLLMAFLYRSALSSLMATSRPKPPKTKPREASSSRQRRRCLMQLHASACHARHSRRSQSRRFLFIVAVHSICFTTSLAADSFEGRARMLFKSRFGIKVAKSRPTFPGKWLLGYGYVLAGCPSSPLQASECVW